MLLCKTAKSKRKEKPQSDPEKDNRTVRRVPHSLYPLMMEFVNQSSANAHANVNLNVAATATNVADETTPTVRLGTSPRIAVDPAFV